MRPPIQKALRSAAIFQGLVLAIAPGLFVSAALAVPLPTAAPARVASPSPALQIFRAARGVQGADSAEWEAELERQRGGKLPLCPSDMRSDDPDFARMRQYCDFNRKKLPLCPEGTQSLDPWGRVNFATGHPLLNPKRRECAKEWTVIAFLAMDNDLSEFGEEDLGEIAWGKALDKSNKIDFVVEADFSVRAGKRYVFEAREGTTGVGASVVKDFFGSEQNTGDPKTLETFLAWAVEEFPARNYVLVMGGHGDGWAATIGTKEPGGGSSVGARLGESVGAPDTGRFGNGIALDESTGDDQVPKDWLTINDLRRALAHVSKRLMGGEPFDLYAADACFMQQAEVAFELRKQARFLYGSIPVMAYQGLPYLDLIRGFVDGKYPDARALALDLPRLMVDSYRAKNDKVYASTVDADALDEHLTAALLEVGRDGRRWLESAPNRLIASFLVMSAVSDAITHQNSVVELSDFLDKLEAGLLATVTAEAPADPKLLALLDSVRRARASVAKTVVASAWGDRYEPFRERILGLSIWMPASRPAYRGFQQHLLRANLHRIHCDCEQDHESPNDWGLFLRSVYVPPN